MENSSQVGILSIMRSHKDASNIKAPQEVLLENKNKNALNHDPSIDQISSKFYNVSPVRMYLADEKKEFDRVLENFQKISLGKIYKCESIESDEVKEIHSNSDLSISVGKIPWGNQEDAKKALEVAEQGFIQGHWAGLSAVERSSVLIKAATLMLNKRLELSCT